MSSPSRGRHGGLCRVIVLTPVSQNTFEVYTGMHARAHAALLPPVHDRSICAHTL